MNIYIPIEVKARELEGRTLLALAAAERGHTVLIGEKNDTIALAAQGKLPPGVVHMKSVTPHEAMKSTLRGLKKHGHAVTVQDEESGIIDETYDTFAKLRFGSETLAMVDRMCAWGNFDARSMKKIYPDFAGNVSLTGSPRVDFWRSDFADFHTEKGEKVRVNGKPYIMIVSNFAGPLNMNRFFNIIARLRVAGYFDREEGRERHDYENFAYQTRLIGEFIFMIRELAAKYADYTILVRPHPVESVDGWHKLMGDVKNVVIERKGTISKWIRNSEMIIQNGCTSALEAAVSRVPRIAYRPIPHPIERDIPNKVSINVFNMEELHDAIDSFLNGKDLHREDPSYHDVCEMLEDRFTATDGALASDRIVDVWDELESELPMPSNSPEEILAVERRESKPISLQMKSFAAGLRDLLLQRPAAANKKEKLLEGGHKFPDFKESELKDIRSSLQRGIGRFSRVEFRRFGPKSYVLYQKPA